MFHVQKRDEFTRIFVDRDVDIVSSAELQSQIDSLAIESDSPVIIDLALCTYCDSCGLNVLIKMKRRWQDHCRIVVPPDCRVRKIFELACLVQILEICDSAEDAVTSVESTDAA